MPKKLSEEQAAKWLEENCSRIRLVKWAGKSTSRSSFLDTDRNISFEYDFNSLKKVVKSNPENIFSLTKEERTKILKPKKTSEEEAKKWIIDNFNHFEIIKWGGKSSSQSLFFDKKRNIYFKYSFSSFKYFLAKDKDFIPGASTSEAAEKFKNRIYDKYGVYNPNNLLGVREKIKETCKDRYGKTCALQNLDISNKIKQSNLNKFGFETPAKNNKVKSKIISTKIKNGQIRLFDGKLISELAKEKNISIDCLNRNIRTHGPTVIDGLSSKKTSIEVRVEQVLKELNLDYIHNRRLKGCNYRPDFVVESHKLIIECDGMYWHSDAVNKNNNHLVDKRKIYASLGYTPLFFREDEIKNKLHIVKSIVKNKLGLSKRAFARKCIAARELDKVVYNKFFDQNHLMGKGSGRVYSLRLNGEIVAAIQVRNNAKGIEISRFCTVNDTSVIGGFSKLLSFVENIENPQFIKTFIDMRYGQGDYLTKLGFAKKTEYPSFIWANGTDTYHRLTFKGNSGYNHDFFKLWDAGQAKYIKSI